MDNVPIVLGQYRLGKTLGIGAFGKVKSTNPMIAVSGYRHSTVITLLNSICLWSVNISHLSIFLPTPVAHHIITGQKVAVKILNKGKIKHMEMAEKVRREINILKMCTHPHIIRL
jgi:5'-AMP-activated protein kinase, catalytic alpha subunit